MKRSATCLLLLLLAALSGCRQEELVSDNRPICFAGTSKPNDMSSFVFQIRFKLITYTLHGITGTAV